VGWEALDVIVMLTMMYLDVISIALKKRRQQGGVHYSHRCSGGERNSCCRGLWWGIEKGERSKKILQMTINYC